MTAHTPAGIDTDASAAGPAAPGEGTRPGPGDLALLGLAALVGLAWGAATSGLQTVLPSPFAGLANAVAPWVAPAFLLGALARTWGMAVVAGLLVCWGEVAGYYAVSSLRDFGVSPAMVATWAVAGLAGGPVLAAAGRLWRCAPSVRWAALGPALLGGVFLTEGAVGYGFYLRYTGDAVLFCVLGALVLLVLAAASPAARAAGGAARGVGAAAAWSVLVLPLGAAGQVALRSLVG